MESTTNLGLTKPALSDTFGTWLNSYNSNFDAVDKLPLPIENGSNSNFSFRKYSDGTCMIWGNINYGTQYPCKSTWSNGFASDEVTLNLPIALKEVTYTFIPSVTANINPDMWFCVRNQTYTYVKGYFLCSINDSSNINTKILNVLIIGKWK